MNGANAARRSSAFTLVELLVVVSIIVLALGMSLVAFNSLTGTRSVESAQNQISAMLARARNEALGLQEYRGVMFYYDQGTDSIGLAIVRETERNPSLNDAITVFLDLVSDADTLPMPKGVGVQLVDDSMNNTDDRYIGFNTYNVIGATRTNDPAIGQGIHYGGVILFDSQGQLVSKTYALKIESGLVSDPFTAMGKFLYRPTNPTVLGTCRDLLASQNISLLPPTQVGLVLFDLEVFKTLHGDKAMLDPQVDVVNFPAGYTATTTELVEENWLDQNALPLLVNRYNGSLIVGE